MNKCVLGLRWRLSVFLLSLLWLANVAMAAVSDGAATLIQNNRTIFSTQLSLKQRLHLNKVNVGFLVTAMVKPQLVKDELATLKFLHLPGGQTLDLLSFDQRKADAGLIVIEAKLSAVVPVDQVQAAYDLAEKHSQSGRVFRVDSLTPYLPHEREENINEQLSLQLYQRATALAKALSKKRGQKFEVAMVNILPGSLVPGPRFKALNLVSGVNNHSAALPMLHTIELRANVVLVSNN